MDILLILGGFVLLLAGGEALVSGAVSIAQRLRVPPMVIGLTLVGFGTSLPELVTSVQAALQGAAGVAVGNVVGSNIANILLILGLAALLAPIAVNRQRFRLDALFLLASGALSAALMLSGMLERSAGLLLVLGLVAFLMATFLLPHPEPDTAPSHTQPPLRATLLFLGGLALVLLGARWLVNGAVGLADSWGVSDSVIGLTIVAVGTSLPELVTSVIAALRRQSDMAFGNIVGSNLFNLLGILGTTALIRPLPVPVQIQSFDLWVMLAATGALILTATTGRGISRPEGLILLAGYGAYLAVLIHQNLPS